MRDLAERVVACKHWRWMPGMLNTYGYRVLEVDEHGKPTRWVLGWYVFNWSAKWPSSSTPDLTDPATLGCLLALVREVWEDPQVVVICLVIDGKGLWCPKIQASQGRAGINYETEAEALVAALEAAP